VLDYSYGRESIVERRVVEERIAEERIAEAW
jgi:hypothetical protein